MVPTFIFFIFITTDSEVGYAGLRIRFWTVMMAMGGGRAP
jgi:hypothetical protein